MWLERGERRETMKNEIEKISLGNVTRERERE